MTRAQTITSRTLLLAAAVTLLSACGGSDDEAAAPDTAAAMAPDTGTMAGMDHSAMAGMNRSAPHDSNQVFLRMMSDHHEGLIAMSDSAVRRTQNARADAQRVLDTQRREQREMLTMLRSTHQDSITPTIMPSNRQMLEAVVRANGAAADTAYYRQVVSHHQEGIRMTEPLMPHLTGEVRRMAQKMVEDQRREAEEFQRKAGGQR